MYGMLIHKIDIRNLPEEFKKWLDELLARHANYEMVVSKYKITHVYVRYPDDGNWNDLKYGRVVVSNNIRYKQIVYKPAIVGDKVYINYDAKKPENNKEAT